VRVACMLKALSARRRDRVPSSSSSRDQSATRVNETAFETLCNGDHVAILRADQRARSAGECCAECVEVRDQRLACKAQGRLDLRSHRAFRQLRQERLGFARASSRIGCSSRSPKLRNTPGTSVRINKRFAPRRLRAAPMLCPCRSQRRRRTAGCRAERPGCRPPPHAIVTVPASTRRLIGSSSTISSGSGEGTTRR